MLASAPAARCGSQRLHDVPGSLLWPGGSKRRLRSLPLFINLVEHLFFFRQQDREYSRLGHRFHKVERKTAGIRLTTKFEFRLPLLTSSAQASQWNPLPNQLRRSPAGACAVCPMPSSLDLVVRSNALPIDNLRVEDKEGDIRLMREVLAPINPNVRLHVVTDGADATGFLVYQGRSLDVPRPQLILLDLNLPKLHGREVPARVKADPGLQTIPVIVLTSSQLRSDVVSSYEPRADSNLIEPDNFSGS